MGGLKSLKYSVYEGNCTLEWYGVIVNGSTSDVEPNIMSEQRLNLFYFNSLHAREILNVPCYQFRVMYERSCGNERIHEV